MEGSEDRSRSAVHWKLRRHALVSVTLVNVLGVYLLVGALVFQSVEGPHEEREKTEISTLREDMINNWNKLREAGVAGGVQESKLLRSELKDYEAQLYATFQNGMASSSDSRNWNFWGSFFFCSTVVSTVGYGNFAPVTELGRVVTILYGLVGIPLCLVTMNELGKLYTTMLKYLYAVIMSFVVSRNESSSTGTRTESQHDKINLHGFQVDDEFNFTLIMSILVVVVYASIGVSLFTLWEDWSILDSAYFFFVTFSTIGFGDIIPHQPTYFLAASLYHLLGLSLVGMLFNVVSEVFINIGEIASNQFQPKTKMA